MMKNFLALIAAAIAICAGVAFVAFWVYWWMTGMFAICAAWVGLPWWGTLIAVIITWVLAPASALIFAIIGFVGWTWTLDWHWYTGLLVYLPTIAVVLGSFISAIALSIIAGIAQLGSNVIGTLRKPWK